MNKALFRVLTMTRTSKRIVQVIADVTILLVSFAFAMMLRYDSVSALSSTKAWASLLFVIPVTILAFIRLGFYRAVIRYMAGRAVTTILIGSAISGIALSFVSIALSLPIPRTVPLIYFGLTFMLIGATRFAFRELVFRRQSKRKESVVIYGAGSAGRQLVQMLRQGTEYLPIAFVDDSTSAQGTQVGGLSVLSPTHLPEFVSEREITSILFAIPSISRARRSEILKSLERLNVQLRSVPGLDDILSGRSTIDEINEVSIEDLLGRDPVAPQPELMCANTRGRAVMVTGAGGSIGSELCRQIVQERPKLLVLFEMSEIALYSIEQELEILRAKNGWTFRVYPILGNVQSREHVARVMRQFAIETVYHAAAYKHVPLVEHNVVEGIRNNVFGTCRVVEAAVAEGVESFILISTDKAVRPTNLMGASKRLAEMACQAIAKNAPKTRVSMVRFGNVLGSSGSVIPLFQKQIAMGGPITVTHPEITRFFMTIPEAAQLVIQAGAMARGGEVFVLDMGEPVRIAELASQMVRLHGYKPVLTSLENAANIVGPGEIGIAFTHLRPGEKLYEELLIGNDPQMTQHSRILCASEMALPSDMLCPILETLKQACDRCDIEAIRAILVSAKTDYEPQDEIVDFDWEHHGPLADNDRKIVEVPHLTLVR